MNDEKQTLALDHANNSDGMEIRNELTETSRKLQGCAVAILQLGESADNGGGAIVGTCWLCEMLADILLESAQKLETIESSL